MLSMEGLVVLRHYLEQGLSKSAIASRLGINRRTVLRYEKSGRREPGSWPRPKRPSKLDPFRDYLRGRLEPYPELSEVRLLSEIRALGYAGGRTILGDYLRTLRQAPPGIERRFETEPGEQAQVDFAVFDTAFGRVHALLVVLSWSRSLHVRFGMHQDQLSLMGGLHRAFVSFGGVPRALLFDRMRAVVSTSAPDGSAVFNAEMLRFASHYGFRLRACRPYRAKTKGKVERAVSYLRSSFFYGRSFRDLEDLNAQAALWLSETANSRVHGTTGEAPAMRLEKEREALRPLPAEAFVPVAAHGRRVTRDGFVSYNGNSYSVPEGVGSRDVEVRPTPVELRLYSGGRLVAVHPLLEGRGGRRLEPSHRRPAGAGDAPPAAAGDPRAFDLIEVEKRPLEAYERVLA
jgi:transposase